MYIGGWRIAVVVVFVIMGSVDGFMNQCGIQFCSNCDPKTKFCNQCDLPYKPGYSNQSVCTRCANNCLVCAKQGTDSSGECLSCQANFDFSKDSSCNTFEIWIYVVVIACYIVFIITIFISFCWMKKRKEKRANQWFQRLKSGFNIVDSEKITVLEFDKMCEYLMQLLKKSSSYNNLRFRDREYEKVMKIKLVQMKQVDTETHMKKLKIIGFDNSEWQGHGYVFIPRDEKSKMKLWFAKNYIRKVHSESISKKLTKFVVNGTIITALKLVVTGWESNNRFKLIRDCEMCVRCVVRYKDMQKCSMKRKKYYYYWQEKQKDMLVKKQFGQ